MNGLRNFNLLLRAKKLSIEDESKHYACRLIMVRLVLFLEREVASGES
jgi:hypothetical protein